MFKVSSSYPCAIYLIEYLNFRSYIFNIWKSLMYHHHLHVVTIGLNIPQRAIAESSKLNLQSLNLVFRRHMELDLFIVTINTKIVSYFFILLLCFVFVESSYLPWHYYLGRSVNDRLFQNPGIARKGPRPVGLIKCYTL